MNDSIRYRVNWIIGLILEMDEKWKEKGTVKMEEYDEEIKKIFNFKFTLTFNYMKNVIIWQYKHDGSAVLNGRTWSGYCRNQFGNWQIHGIWHAVTLWWWIYNIFVIGGLQLIHEMIIDQGIVERISLQKINLCFDTFEKKERICCLFWSWKKPRSRTHLHHFSHHF